MRERIVEGLRDAPDVLFALGLIALALLLAALSAALHVRPIPLGLFD